MNEELPVSWNKWEALSAHADVCLVHMPFARLHSPSISLGILKSALMSADIETSVVYGNLMFADQIDFDLYGVINLVNSVHHLHQWMFAISLFDSKESYAYYERILKNELHLKAQMLGLKLSDEHIRTVISELFQTRASTPEFIDKLAHHILAKRPRVVGCTSALFQLTAVLALFKRIHELAPKVITIAGGPDFWGKSGGHLLLQCPFMDIVFSGEADQAIVPLIKLLTKNGRAYSSKELPFGAVDRNVAKDVLCAESLEGYPKARVDDLDESPIPDYKDFFKSLDLCSYRNSVYPGLLIETSRGCWWAAKKGCKFCNMSAFMNTFRSKSPQRALMEFNHLAENYGYYNFAVSDSAIDTKYFESVIPELTKSENPYRLFYEIRPNLSPDHIQQLADAGVYYTQVGIEGLHDKMLQIMNKGITAIRNLQLMKFTRQFGITIVWNYLCGFPGESDKWHEEVASWLPLIHHFNPPSGIEPSKLVYIRGNHFFRERHKYGLELEPAEVYRYIYPFPKKELENIVFFFREKKDSSNIQQNQLTPGITALREAFKAWHEAYFHKKRPAQVIMNDQGDQIIFHDTRPCAFSSEFAIQGLAAEICRRSDRVITRKQLTTSLLKNFKGTIEESQLEKAIQELKDKKLIIEINNRFLGLAHSKAPRKISKSKYDFPGGIEDPPDLLKIATGRSLKNFVKNLFN